MSSLSNPSDEEKGASNVNGTTHNSNGSINGTAAESRNGNSGDEESFVKIDTEEVVADCGLTELITTMKQSHYNIHVKDENLINLKCKILFEKDYRVEIVKNNGFTANYPKEIIIPVATKDDAEKNPTGFDAERYVSLVRECLTARLRSRFVVPTILFDNKFICRSVTVSVYLSSSYEALKSSIPTPEDIAGAISDPANAISNVVSKGGHLLSESVKLIRGENVMEEKLLNDLKLLRYLKVDRICDLMVEFHKNYKDIVNLSSSEKANEGIYTNIKIQEMPFPGCEFFLRYSTANRQPKGIVFDWNQKDVERGLMLTECPSTFFPDMDTENSRTWDIVQLTQNYLKIILSQLLTGTGSMVVHCLSGWDRTPLFISLIRLSLWADGVIHQNLDFKDMAYLTVAYDWFLFGHDLPDRLLKGEEVMHFCFVFLKYIRSDEFSITRMFSEMPSNEKENRSFPEYIPGKREVLRWVSNYVLERNLTKEKVDPSWENFYKL